MAHYNIFHLGKIHIPLWKLVTLVTFALFANVTDVANLHGGILKANSTTFRFLLRSQDEIGKRLIYDWTHPAGGSALAPAPASSCCWHPTAATAAMTATACALAGPFIIGGVVATLYAGVWY